MRFLLFLPALLMFAGLSAAKADERPTLPKPGVDSVLTKGKEAKTFFDDRAADGPCRRQLHDAQKADRAARAQVTDLVAKGAPAAEIDSAQAQARASRERLLPWMESCGACAIQEVEKRVVRTAGRTEVWYVSDGSCQLPEQSPERLKKIQARLVDRLSRVRQYSGKNGGFYDILEFVAVDGETGKLLPEVDKVEQPPFFAFIAVRGPEILKQKTAASYFVRNEFGTGSDGSWTLTFQGTKAPRSFQAPDVYDVAASGRRTIARQLRIHSVHGMWHVTPQGYLRYHTAADFGVSLQFAADLAKRILLDTLVQLAEVTEAVP